MKGLGGAGGEGRDVCDHHDGNLVHAVKFGLGGRQWRAGSAMTWNGRKTFSRLGIYVSKE